MKKGKFVSEWHKHFLSKFTYSNEIELLNLVIQIFSLVELGESLTDKQNVVLRNYLRSGYTSTTKRAIMLENKMDVKHLDQINFILTKKGFLEKHPTNYRMKIVSPKLLELKTRVLAQQKEEKAIFYTIFLEKKPE